MIDDKPKMLQGGAFSDARGLLKFVNDFNFQGVKRFYQASNRDLHFVRAWQGHQKEGKYVYVATGSALVGAVKLDAPIAKSNDASGETRRDSVELPAKFILSAKNPSVLWIPPGYANGWMNLEHATNIFFFSTATLEESKADDFRFPPTEWNIWNVESFPLS